MSLLCCDEVFLVVIVFKVMGRSPLGIFSAMVKVDRPTRKRPFPIDCNWLMELLGVDLE